METCSWRCFSSTPSIPYVAFGHGWYWCTNWIGARLCRGVGDLEGYKFYEHGTDFDFDYFDVRFMRSNRRIHFRSYLQVLRSKELEIEFNCHCYCLARCLRLYVQSVEHFPGYGWCSYCRQLLDNFGSLLVVGVYLCSSRLSWSLSLEVEASRKCKLVNVEMNSFLVCKKRSDDS